MNETEEQLREAAKGMDSRESSTTCDGTGTAPPDGGETPREAPCDMGPLDRILTTIERREILAALQRANGQRTRAARLLGISRSRLYRRMEALGIDPRGLSDRAPEVHPSKDV